MGGLFSKPKTPEVKPPAPMPTPIDVDELNKQRKRREAAATLSQSGRASTILSDSGGGTTLGG